MPACPKIQRPDGNQCRSEQAINLNSRRSLGEEALDGELAELSQLNCILQTLLRLGKKGEIHLWQQKPHDGVRGANRRNANAEIGSQFRRHQIGEIESASTGKALG